MSRVYGGMEHGQKVALPQKSQLTSSEEILHELFTKIDITDLPQRFMNISMYIDALLFQKSFTCYTLVAYKKRLTSFVLFLQHGF